MKPAQTEQFAEWFDSSVDSTDVQMSTRHEEYEYVNFSQCSESPTY